MVKISEVKSIPKGLLGSLKWVYYNPIKFFFPAIIGIIIYGLITTFFHFGSVETSFVDSFIFVLLASLLICHYYNCKIFVKKYALKILLLIFFDMAIKMIEMIPFYLTTSGKTEIPQVIFMLLPLLLLFLRSITILSIYSVLIENNKLGLLNGIKIFLSNTLYYFFVTVLIILLGTLFQLLFSNIIKINFLVLGRIISFIDIIIKCFFIIMVIAHQKISDSSNTQTEQIKG